MNEANLPPGEFPAELRDWLRAVVEAEASDLHLVVGHPPVMRLHGDLLALPGSAISADEAQGMLSAVCTPHSLARLRADKQVDSSFEVSIDGRSRRFRANVFHAGGALCACLRAVPAEIPDFEWTGFPEPLARKLALLLDGLVIVTGATGSGKSTTLATIVNLLNRMGEHRIITVEEPVEYLFPKLPNSVVTQREVGHDVLTFADGLKSGLRQDPDVILVGEIRDRETAQMALSAAETGRLVFTTLHTRDAKGAVSRFADLFPQDVQSEVRCQLSQSLRAVVAQRLLPGVEKGTKRHLALEVLWNTTPIASSIRSGKVESIDNYLLTGREDGMLSFDESVRRLLRDGCITPAVAELNVREPAYLHRPELPFKRGGY